jgi:hypothetical protein
MGPGDMRSTDEGAAVSSSLPNLGGVSLEQVTALAPGALDTMVQRVLPRSQPSFVPTPTFGSCI